MKNGIHRGLGLLLAIVVVAMLAACSTKDSVSEVPDKDDSDAIVPPASVLPFADVVDLSEYFVDEPANITCRLTGRSMLTAWMISCTDKGN